MTVKRCRCRNQKEREVPCYKEYLCESKCSKMRDCGKHQCKRKVGENYVPFFFSTHIGQFSGVFTIRSTFLIYLAVLDLFTCI